MMWFVPMKTAERLDGAALRLVCRQATIATMQAAIAATADQSISAATHINRPHQYQTNPSAFNARRNCASASSAKLVASDARAKSSSANCHSELRRRNCGSDPIKSRASPNVSIFRPSLSLTGFQTSFPNP